MPVVASVVHVVAHPLPGGLAAQLMVVAGELWLVADRSKRDAGAHAGLLLRTEAPRLLARLATARRRCAAA